MKMNRGNEKYYYYSPEPGVSKNGLYVIRCGKTLPDPRYYMERDEDFAKKTFGGVYVLEYVVSGTGYIECDGVTTTVMAGDLYFLNKLKAHKYYADAENPYCKLWINFTGAYAHALIGALGITKGVLSCRMSAGSRIEKIHSLLSNITVPNRQRTFDQAALIITELLLDLRTASEGESGDNGSVLGEIKDYMDSVIGRDVGLDAVCAHFHINKSYFIQLFRSAYGVTPHRYLTEKRVEAAKKLLEGRDTEIKAISELVGFSSTQYFSTVFKKYTSFTPGEYRKRTPK